MIVSLRSFLAGAILGVAFAILSIALALSFVKHRGYEIDFVRTHSAEIPEAGIRWDGDTITAPLVLLEAAKRNYFRLVRTMPEIDDMQVSVPFSDDPRFEGHRTASIVVTVRKGATLTADTVAFLANLARTAFGIASPERIVMVDQSMRQIWPFRPVQPDTAALRPSPRIPRR
jgi:hypothetical protein